MNFVLRLVLAAMLGLWLAALALYALVSREASSGEKRQQAERSLGE